LPLPPATDVISLAPAATADGVNMESESRKFRNAPSSSSPGHRVLPDVHAANWGTRFDVGEVTVWGLVCGWVSWMYSHV